VKILVATGLTQGTSPRDYHYCVEGELVWIQEPCDRDRRDPDEGCGCGRGFAGAASHRATTTATVVESDLTREDLVLAYRTSLEDGGWPVAWAEDVTDDVLQLIAPLRPGTIMVRRLDELFLRGALFR
jgi:hypothetical protein